ncbi:hypothetical protein AWENTII_010373 [Aspergillus wentii]|nr:hypothetical protein MW887_009557 [Aspergillus wentii]
MSLNATVRNDSQPAIDLFRGWPNPALLPVTSLANSSATVYSSPAIYTPGLLYGPDDGHPPLRQHLARWLTSFYRPRDPVTADRICITGGASQNLACVLQVFADPGYTRNVWMVAPGYHLACRIFDDAGFAGRLRAVPEDEEGLNVGFFRGALEAAEKAWKGDSESQFKSAQPWRKIYKHVIYATPTFSNPSTKTMTLRRREELVRLAREFDALIVTDDVYDLLQWSSDPNGTLAQPDQRCAPRLVDVDRYLDGGPQHEFGNAVSNGSFSKLIGPGLRTGWAEGTPKLAYGVSQAGSTRSGGAPSQMSSTIVAQLFSDGVIESHIEKVLQPAYAERYHIVMSAIREHLLPLGVALPSTTQETAGGYFIWIDLPQPLQANEIVQRAKQEENLTLAPGDLFRVQGDEKAECNKFNRSLRLCFVWEAQDQLAEGIRRLARVVGRAADQAK